MTSSSVSPSTHRNRSSTSSSSGNSSSGTVTGSGNSSSNEEEEGQQQCDGANASFPSHQVVPPQEAIEAGAAMAAAPAPGAVPLAAGGGVGQTTALSSPVRVSRDRGGMAVVGLEGKERDQEQQHQEHQEQLQSVVEEQHHQEQLQAGSGKTGVTASPVRRSQTQAAMLVDGGKGGIERGGGEEGADDASLVILPHAPRIGPMYQVLDESLPVCHPLLPATAGTAAAAAAAAVCSRVGEVARKGLIWSSRDVEEDQAQALMEGLMQMHGSSSSSSSSVCSSDSGGGGSGSGSGRGPEKGIERGGVGDEGVEVGWVVLRATGSVAKAMAAAVDYSERAAWREEEETTFLEGMNEYDKNFKKIQVSPSLHPLPPFPEHTKGPPEAKRQLQDGLTLPPSPPALPASFPP